MARPSLHLPLLLDIPEPCAEDWQAMSGDERARHCQRCDQSVHNAAELGEAEIAELLERGACLRLSLDPSGALLTAEARRPGSAGRVARFAVTAALVALSACDRRKEPFEIQGFTHLPPPTPALTEAYEQRQAEQARLEAQRDAEREARLAEGDAGPPPPSPAPSSSAQRPVVLPPLKTMGKPIRTQGSGHDTF